MADIERLPLYGFWEQSMMGSGCPIDPDTEEMLAWLHDWEAFCQMFIETGRHRYMRDDRAR